ncbi:MAG: hypothetical protein V3V08_03370 [Nannocystaceae bacterium]
MSNFDQFYSDGGVFMHAVSIFAAAGAYHTFKAVAIHLQATRQEPDNGTFDTTIKFATGLLVLCVGMGVLGTLVGLLEVGGGVVKHAALEAKLDILARGTGIAANPTSLALMASLPLYFLGLLTRHGHGRGRSER